MEDFYKFKSDVYSYLDGRFENINGTYTNKFESLFDFMETTSEKLRSISELKEVNELRFEEFKNKYT